ncbi:MAG: hypothetical protein HW416_941 [Chloroflexi bacterium]|nr:hypothetical protein [Chloroflexota bacterium]
MAATVDRIETVQADVSMLDMQHTGPGTLAGRYLRMFWHPIDVARYVSAGRAKPIRVMSEAFTLYRGESGAPHLVAFRCAHRGTQLSTGWVEGDDLRCFYHGWKYDGSGQCIEQPAEPEPFCNRIKIRGYPTEEYLGLIFAYLGEGEPPSFPRFPDFEQGRVEANVYLRSCNFYNRLDNDGIHTWFVHRRAGHDFRDWHGRIPRAEWTEDEWGLVNRSGRPEARQVTHRGMPTLTLRKQAPAETNSPRDENSIAWQVPVDDESHLAFQVDVTLSDEEPPRPTDAANWAVPDELAEEILSGSRGREYTDFYRTDILKPVGAGAIVELDDGRTTDMVKVQDCVSQSGQGRIADRGAEHLGHTDGGVILYRKIWERELRALADGRPLKQWHRPESHISGQ